MAKLRFLRSLLRLAALLFAGLQSSQPAALATDEVCASCSQQVSVSGDFAHRKDDPSVTIDGADDAAPFREDVNGENFTVAISALPAGVYDVTITAAETVAGRAGDRFRRYLGRLVWPYFDIVAG
jgi:hypothetical protein